MQFLDVPEFLGIDRLFADGEGYYAQSIWDDDARSYVIEPCGVFPDGGVDGVRFAAGTNSWWPSGKGPWGGKRIDVVLHDDCTSTLRQKSGSVFYVPAKGATEDRIETSVWGYAQRMAWISVNPDRNPMGFGFDAWSVRSLGETMISRDMNGLTQATARTLRVNAKCGHVQVDKITWDNQVAPIVMPCWRCLCDQSRVFFARTLEGYSRYLHRPRWSDWSATCSHCQAWDKTPTPNEDDVLNDWALALPARAKKANRTL